MSVALTNHPLVIENLPLASLLHDPASPRIHSRKQIRFLCKSLKEFGFVLPILTDGACKIINGHALVQAAKECGFDVVPVTKIEHLDAARIKALGLALNRLSELGRWDENKLGLICKELVQVDLSFDIKATGFSLDELELRVEGLGLDNELPDADDQAPPLDQARPVSKKGDIWQLGQHKIMCGDATDPADVNVLMSDCRAAMTFTDPPYNVDYANSAKDKLRGTDRPILNDNLGMGFPAFLQRACTNIAAVTDGAVYICMSSSELHTLYNAFEEAGGSWSTFIIWAKQTFTLGRADYQRQYEPILYGWTGNQKRHWCGDRDQGDVWFFDKPAHNDLHPTMKPIGLVMRALRNSSERGSITFDPFLGSGTTLIAAERTGRICYGIELAPVYVDCCVRRWQEHTGEKAIHVATGKSFNEMAAEVANGQPE